MPSPTSPIAAGSRPCADDYLDVVELQTRCALALDDDDLEGWIDCFADPCVYKVITAETVAAGLEAGVLFCDSKAMLEDRVAYIRKAAVYNLHRDLHVLGQPLVRPDGGDRFSAVTSYAVYQCEPDREVRLFAVGHYRDVIVREAGRLRFASRVVVLQNDAIKPLLAAPI